MRVYYCKMLRRKENEGGDEPWLGRVQRFKCVAGAISAYERGNRFDDTSFRLWKAGIPTMAVRRVRLSKAHFGAKTLLLYCKLCLLCNIQRCHSLVVPLSLLPGGSRRRQPVHWHPAKLFSSSSSNQPSMSEPSPPIDRDAHVCLLSENLKACTGHNLTQVMGLLLSRETEWHAQVHTHLRYALLSHGSVNGLDGPINNYANFAACLAFSYPRAQLLDMPAGRMALPMDQEDVSQEWMDLRKNPRNVVQQYQGARCTSDQRRFFVRDAVVRNMKRRGFAGVPKSNA